MNPATSEAAGPATTNPSEPAESRSQVRSLLGRAGWVAADQAVSSINTAGLTLLVARDLGASAFGSFALAFTVYTFLIGAAGAGGGSPYTIRWAKASRAEARPAAAHATGWTVLFGAAAGVVVLVIGLVMGGSTGHALAAVAPALPLLFLQDCWRGILITDKRPAAALVNDLVWAVVQFGALAVVLPGPAHPPWVYVTVWGAAAAVSAAVGVVQTGVVPSFRGITGWLRTNADISKYMAGESLSVLAASQLTIILVSALGGAAQVGALRGASTVLGPLTLLSFAVGNFVVPEVARRRLSRRGSYLTAAAVGGALAAITMLWAIVFLLLPPGAGAALLGSTWPRTHHVLLPMAFSMAASLAGMGPFVVMRGMARARATFAVNGTQAVLLVTFGTIGAALDGAVGAASGLAAAAWLTLPLWGLQLRRTIAGAAD